MIASLGSDVKPLALFFSSLHISYRRGRKQTHDVVRKRVGDVDPSVVVYLICAVIGLGGRGEIIH